jgi:hypothetical protein
MMENREIKKDLVYQAKREIIMVEAMRKMLDLDDDPVIQIKVNGTYNHGFSNVVKQKIIDACDQEIEEIEKAIKGEKNNWE